MSTPQPQWFLPERRAVARLPRDAHATVTGWEERRKEYSPDKGWYLAPRIHHGITDGYTTVEYPTQHAARMAAWIHNHINGTGE